MKALSKRNKLKSFIAPNMRYIITFLDNSVKYAICRGGKIYGLYFYLEMIGSPTTLTTSGQCSDNFGTFYSISNDTETTQPVISALRMI